MNAPPLDPPSVESLVTLAVDDFLERQRHGENPDVEEYARRYPQLATLLRSLLPTLRLMQSPDSGGGGAPPAPLAERLGDYRLIRMLGRGGMGVVYEAEQVSLQRRVALKVLPFAAALDPMQLQRFKNEAQAAAHLQHPRIVPVYTVGCEQGIHFFAMQFIEGQSLAGLLRERRGVAGAEQSEAPVAGNSSSLSALETATSIRSRAYQRAVARLGVQAADALEHAHRQGVIHRDIKPGNLLLDPQGVLWLTDFGLARCACDGDLTQSGDVIGTLPYMSPEQALAQRDLVDQRTDVYALGATLYELLTLAPPFSGSDRQEVLRQIAEQDPRPPRSRNPAVPPDLETILLKTLEKHPAERYRTAQHLADDLQRFLDDQPIRARRPSWGQRLKKWSRRHRTVVAAAAVCMILAVGLLTLSSLWFLEHHLRRQDAHAAKLREQEQVRENLDRSLQLLEAIFLRAAGRGLLREAEREQADQKLLEQGLRFYQQFAERNATNSMVRHQTARAHFRVAYIQKHLGRLEEAEKAYDEAITLLERLAADYPQVYEYPRELASSFHMRASIRYQRGQAHGAAADMQHEEKLLQRLVDKHPEAPACHAALASCRNNRSLFLYNRGQLEEADTLLRQFLPAMQHLAVEHPNELELQHEIAVSHSLRGHILASLGQPVRAEDAYREAIRIVHELTERPPQPPEYRLKHAALHHHLAALLRVQGRLQEARQAHELARSGLRQLVADFPNMPDLQKELADVNDQYGLSLAALGERRAAEARFREATDAMERLTRAFPSRYEYRMSLGSSWNNLGILLARSQRAAAAEQAYDKAADAYAALVERFPEDPIHAHRLGGIYNNLARIFRSAGDLDKAQAHFDTAVHHQRIARSMNPDHAGYRAALCQHYENLLGLLLGHEDHRSAARCAEQLLRDVPNHWVAAFRAARTAQRCRDLVSQQHTRSPREAAAHAQEYTRLARQWWANAVTLAADHAEAQDELAWHLAHDASAEFRDARAAIKLAESAVKKEPRKAKYWLTLGSAYCRLNDWPNAVRTLHLAWRLNREEGGEACFFLAMAHWHENDRDLARFWYRRGLEWMRRHERGDEAVRGFQGEAAALLGQATGHGFPG